MLWRFDNWYIIASGDLINDVILIIEIDLPQIICGYNYYIICLLYRNYTSLHCFMLSTRIKATVPSIRYFNWRKNQIAFCSINWQLMLSLV